MSDYTVTTNFTAKDALAPGHPDKVITGTAHGTEYANIATAVNSKADKASPTFTGTVVLPATTSIGTVSSTELGYLDGVTSAIQTQLDAKLASATAASTYAALSGAGFTGRVVATRDSQTAYSSSAIEAGSVTGDVHISFHAQGASACSLKHTRNGSGLSLVGTDGSTGANFAAATGTFSGLVYGRGGGNGLGQITVSTSAPSGMQAGDIWFQY